MATETRTWTETDHGGRMTTWTSTDGKALVVADRKPTGWVVSAFEATGPDDLSHPASYIGSEPSSASRAGAMAVARRWVRKLTRPTID